MDIICIFTSSALYLFTLSFCLFKFSCLCKLSQAGLVMKPHPLFVCFCFLYLLYTQLSLHLEPVTSEMTLSINESELVVVCACVNTLTLECFRWDISDHVLELSAVKQQVPLCHHGNPVSGWKNSVETHSSCQTPAIWVISTYNPVMSDKKPCDGNF